MTDVGNEVNDLDDFFAKKDKTKKKSKSKITTDEIEGRLEKKLKKAKSGSSGTKKDKGSSSGGKVLDVRIGDDDTEWKEVESEETKDYSDLRIQNLPTSDRGQDDRDENGGYREEGDEGDGKGGVPGPWKPVNNPPQPAAPSPVLDEKPPVVESKPPESTPAKTGKYVPPGARNTASKVTPLPAVSVSGGHGKRKTAAPNVESHADFPTLGQVASEGPDFQQVRGGGRRAEDPASQISKLSLENKYGTLGTDQNTVG